MVEGYDDVPWSFVEEKNTISSLQKKVKKTRYTINIGGNASIFGAYLLWLFLGWAGVHHLYVGRGLIIWVFSLITFQGFGLWWIADFFLLPFACRKIRGQTTVVLNK